MYACHLLLWLLHLQPESIELDFNCVYTMMQQDDIEESSRAELWREELIEEIEQKVGGLRELEEAGKKEELIK